MVHKKNTPWRDAAAMIRAERSRLAALGGDAVTRQEFWEERYRETYGTLLDERSEYGRYGVVTEYLLRMLPGGSVLDIGCGPGILAGMLQHSTLTYTGIDISATAVRMAQERHPALREHFHHTPLEAFPGKEAYDAIVAVEILYYLDTETFFTHCSRLLKKDGHLIVTVYDFPEGRALLPQVMRRLHDPFRAEVYNAGKELRWHIVAGVFSA